MHHELFTESVNKIALSADDNKRTILPDRINTLAHKTLAQTDKATGEAWQKARGAWGKDMMGTEGPWQSDRGGWGTGERRGPGNRTERNKEGTLLNRRNGFVGRTLLFPLVTENRACLTPAEKQKITPGSNKSLLDKCIDFLLLIGWTQG